MRALSNGLAPVPVQAVVLLMVLLATEHRILQRAQTWGRRLTRLFGLARDPALQPYEALQTHAADERASVGAWEDVDVQREREAVESLTTTRREVLEIGSEVPAGAGLASAEDGMPLVVARQLVKVYPGSSVAAVKGVSFMVPRGEVS